MKLTKVEFMCTWCGRKETRSAIMGRPLPGACLKKPKSKDGKSKPHTWVVNRKY